MHFIRKQIHVESSPLLVDLIEKTIQFWITADRKVLEPYVSEEILEELKLIDDHLKELQLLFKGLLNDLTTEQILLTPIDVLVNKVESFPVSEIVKNKAMLTIRLYQLLHAKYKTEVIEVESFF